MTDKNEWWLKKFNEKNWGACFECCDYEGMVDDIRGILAEHTRRIVEAVEGMRQEIKLLGNYERGCDKHLSATEECRCYGWNAALDEAIEKIKGLDGEPS